MKIIIWLGNIGEKYHFTRHNSGFLAIDFLQKFFKFEDFKDSKFSAKISEWNIAWEKIILVKPTTFMNLSGEAVVKIMNFYKIEKSNILVISDDIDMDFGKIRYREKWSHGGQNWLRDIITKIGDDNFARIKIWIWRHPQIPVSDWVLSRFQKEELENLEKHIFAEVLTKVEEFLWK